MMLILHIVIALVGLGVATWAWQRPSKRSLQAGAGFLAATLASGTWLVVMSPAHMVSACLSGLLYTAFVAAALSAGHRKLRLSLQRAQ